MPWHARNLVEEREAFVILAKTGNEHFSRLCRLFGISRRVGYKWRFRYQQAGEVKTGLLDRSRRPHRIYKTSIEVEQQVLGFRDRYGWGPFRLARALQAEGISIARSTLHKILKKHRRTSRDDPKSATWIHQVLVAQNPDRCIAADVSNAQPTAWFAENIRNGSLRNRKNAMAVAAKLKGINIRTIQKCLGLTPRTINRYCEKYVSGGVEELLRAPKSKINDEPYRDSVFAILHSPPAAHGINRTSWKMADLQRVIGEKTHRLSEERIRRIIKAGGYRWRKAKLVLTSKDPEYEPKLRFVKEILANLTPDQAFFSIDEYGPFAVKQKPGRKLVEPDNDYVVPQWQKSRG
jgi:transposase